MSIEQALAALTAALQDNTAALKRVTGDTADAPAAVRVPLGPLPVETAPDGAPKRGRPPKAAAATAPTTAPVAQPAPVATPAAVSAPVAGTAPADAPALTHAQLSKPFLAAGKAHGREFVVKLLGMYNASTFDKVPLDKLAEFKANLEAGPQPKTVAVDTTDLLG